MLKPAGGMSASHFVRFARHAGLLDGAGVGGAGGRRLAKADLEILHARLCATQARGRRRGRDARRNRALFFFSFCI